MYWSAHRNEEPQIHYMNEVTRDWINLRYVKDLDGRTLLDKAPFYDKDIV